MNTYRHKLKRITVRGAVLVLSAAVFASGQERKVDPTWLHRYVPQAAEAKMDFSTATCQYKPIFGEGDAENKIMRSVERFGQATVAPGGKCQPVTYDRQEEIYFVLKGSAQLLYGGKQYPMRANDFTYLPPGKTHSIANAADQELQIMVMSFRIPPATSLVAAAAEPTIVNMDTLKEETVDGHPNSVLYKLMLGPRKGTRDAIDQAYVVTSLFWMDFAPGGTNFPHHHETAEEIYVVIDGEGEMVAGGGTDGIEGRHPAKPGDAYYFRPNCTVGFYNQNKAGAKAHILAVRSQIPLAKNDD
jgi:mannose-6-phosphate isomerase-like protein (cupin superfamily)